MTPLGEAALKYASKGLRVFPCKVRSKEPLINDNLNRATTDENTVRGWWLGRAYNIAIATGCGSGVWVVDVDGDQGEQTLRSLEAEHGPLPATVEVITGAGRHLYWRWPTGVEIRNSQCRDDLPGIDWRGEGGYVLAPPSIHPRGRVYSWLVDSASEFADAPDWLLDLVTGKTTSAAAPATPPAAWRSFIEDTYEGSRRGAAIARLAGLLLRRFIDPWVALSICQLFNMVRNSPPLAWFEVHRIVDAIAGREADRREKARRPA